MAYSCAVGLAGRFSGETRKTGNQVMHPVIPPEMISSAVQLAVYFVTAVAVLFSVMMTARA